ncbi:MAG TPA: YceI family protein [Pyrinomonadaceae bacterium]|nr:YceI family protein [Pyrinomonadaceae bacterium]HMP66012.1 YceI family protein [Pyrinomonadaceae bacterium]
MRTFGLVILFTALSLVLACEDPADNKPSAKLTETNTDDATNARTIALSEAETGVKGEALAISPENSRIEFVGSKVTGKHDGGFSRFIGTIDLVDGMVEGSTVTVEIDMASVFTDDERLTEHLRTQDFFEIASYPKSHFRLTKIERDRTAGEDTYAVTGDLELRSVRRSIEFPATIRVNDADVEVVSEFSFNRKDFGIVYSGKADDLIRDRVLMRLNLKAPRKGQ